MEKKKVLLPIFLGLVLAVIGTSAENCLNVSSSAYSHELETTMVAAVSEFKLYTVRGLCKFHNYNIKVALLAILVCIFRSTLLIKSVELLTRECKNLVLCFKIYLLKNRNKVQFSLLISLVKIAGIKASLCIKSFLCVQSFLSYIICYSASSHIGFVKVIDFLFVRL